ncbi:MAG: YkgJ family cysteine cluster protein [Deltaproteobacteria bacterium]|nr:YkgJ family cysteine cluster protein [Deltaproteobacteria bacterium]
MSDVSTLCRSCALCCDGTLFTHVTVSSAEGATLRRHALEIVTRAEDENLRLPQPCKALSGCVCTIYDARPASCRAYVCLLAQALTEGEVGLPEAQAIVAEAHAHRAHARLDPSNPSAQTAQREHLQRHFTGRTHKR